MPGYGGSAYATRLGFLACRCVSRRCVAESDGTALRKIIETVELIPASVKSETQQVLALRDGKVVSFIERIERPAPVVVDTGSNHQRTAASDN